MASNNPVVETVQVEIPIISLGNNNKTPQEAAPINLGPGACQIGSLEAGKKKTRRSKRSSKPKQSLDDVNSAEVSQINEMFAHFSIDSTVSVIPQLKSSTDGNAASCSNGLALDPGGKLIKNSRTKTINVCDGSSSSVVPVETESQESKKRNRGKRGSKSSKTVASPGVVASPKTPDSRDSPSTNKWRQKNYTNNNAKDSHFSDYLPEVVVDVGLEGKHLIRSTIRINPKDFQKAYVTSPDKNQDILIEGIPARNRALEGDDVVVQINPFEQWHGSGKDIQKTGTVVFIKSKVHPRLAVGLLKPMADKNVCIALFSPRDSRVPRIRVPISTCPIGFLANHAQYDRQLFLASITDWTDTRFAIGQVVEEMGPIGDLKAENTSILFQNDLKTEPYSSEMHSYYPRSPFTIPQEEFAKREDLRKECIFTIDPATARDLDDAMSCKELPNGNVEIGVHISDVSYFVEENTPFDLEVAERATSTYLVDTVYHMLPRELCMTCSLLPGEDKLAYSVFWEINIDAEVINHRFTRSVINSCTQLSYEHAQEMLDVADKKWLVDEIPPIHNGFNVNDLTKVVQHLHRLAFILRKRRFDGGALRIDQPKLVFNLDKISGHPTGFTSYVNKESHRLIEEFMLLANMTVAQKIFNDFPKLAFLRSHLPPHPFLLNKLSKTFESYGIHLDITSSGGLQKTMKMYEGEDFPSQARMMVIYSRCAKPMARARYFCANNVTDTEDFSHYALNVPLYTHFTSPIRRYPDIMVHRLLSASLKYTEPPKWNPDAVHKIASNCNKMKFAAKLAGEQSEEIYLSLYIGNLGQMLESAVVIDVKDRSFDVIICRMGVNQRVYVNNLHAEVKHTHMDDISKLEITWLPTDDVPHTTVQTIELFVIVTVLVTKAPKLLKIESQLMRPSISGNTFSKVKI